MFGIMFTACELELVTEIGLRTFGGVLKFNRIMCNVADHVQNVAKALRRYRIGAVDMLFADARHDLAATSYDSSELTSTRGGRDYYSHVHVRSDFAQGRYHGMSSMRVLKVPFRAKGFVAERLVADQVAVAPDTSCLLSFAGITPCVRGVV